MTRLVLAELSRLRSRRLTWVALILVALAIALLQVAVFFSVKPLSPAELAQGQAQYQDARKDYEQNKADYEANEKQCLADGNAAEDCSFEPKPENYTTRVVSSYSEITEATVTVVVFGTGLALLFMGASFVGAEFSSGALANWLSFIPERGKVYFSKLLALVLAAAVVTAVATALTIGLAALVSKTQGATVTGVRPLLEMAGRGVAVGVIGAVIGFGFAMLTRHTIAAAGTVLGYLLLSFVLAILGGSIAALQKIKPWLPENNVLAFLNHGYKYETYVNVITEHGMEQTYVEHTISFGHSAVYWAVLVVALVAATFVLFRRRDVN